MSLITARARMLALLDAQRLAAAGQIAIIEVNGGLEGPSRRAVIEGETFTPQDGEDKEAFVTRILAQATAMIPSPAALIFGALPELQYKNNDEPIHLASGVYEDSRREGHMIWRTDAGAFTGGHGGELQEEDWWGVDNDQQS